MRFLLLSSALLFGSHVSFADTPPSYGGCTPDRFVTIDANQVTIGFQGSSYSPSCVKVKVGTQVTILASPRHPLQASLDFQGVLNPFRTSNNVVAHEVDQTRVMDNVGFYGFYCTRHGDANDGRGMGGVIWVVPAAEEQE